MKSFGKRLLFITAVIGLIGAAGFQLQKAVAQAPPVAVTSLAHGSSPDPDLKIKAKGPTEMFQDRITFQPGGGTGWHTHPGPALVIVTQGAVTLYQSDGCKKVYPAGSFFSE